MIIFVEERFDILKSAYMYFKKYKLFKDKSCLYWSDEIVDQGKSRLYHFSINEDMIELQLTKSSDRDHIWDVLYLPDRYSLEHVKSEEDLIAIFKRVENSFIFKEIVELTGKQVKDKIKLRAWKVDSYVNVIFDLTTLETIDDLWELVTHERLLKSLDDVFIPIYPSVKITRNISLDDHVVTLSLQSHEHVEWNKAPDYLRENFIILSWINYLMWSLDKIRNQHTQEGTDIAVINHVHELLLVMDSKLDRCKQRIVIKSFREEKERWLN